MRLRLKKMPETPSSSELDDEYEDEGYETPPNEEFLNEWDSGHLDFYMGTKKELLLFLDDQERQRTAQLKGHTDTKKATGSPKTPPADKGSRSRLESDTPLKKTVSGISLKSSHSKSSAKTSPPTQAPSEVLGFEPAYLSEILCPPKQMCNQRFEISIDEKVFLGLPVHSYEDGSWRASKRRAKSAKSHGSRPENEPIPDADGSAADLAAKASSMNMFHVVFVMNPPVIECNYRIDEMFHYVVSRLLLALRYEQLKHQYVSKQLQTISKLKDEWRSGNGGSSMHQFLVARSSLCKLISECYSAVSALKIANLAVNGKLRLFQIPVKTEFVSLPDPTVPFLPGSHLSTTVKALGNTGLVGVGETSRYGSSSILNGLMMGSENAAGGPVAGEEGLNDEEDRSSAHNVVHFALLLLDDPESIIKDIKADSHSALAAFIRLIRPTDSLLKLSNAAGQQDNGLDIAQIRAFAVHLVYWRRARLVAPLSTRSVYIVSPMAPITTNLYKDIIGFRESFATLPSLPHFLKLLLLRSRKPRQFAHVIPSRDHRDVYLAALAWLIRHGYVTQLHTFIWLKILRKIKISVEEDLENEGKGPKKKRESVASDKVGRNTDNKVGGDTDNSGKKTDNSSKKTPLEPHKEPSSTSSSVPMASPANFVLEKDIEALERKLKVENSVPKLVFEDDDDTIIVDPGRATTLERRWINKVVSDECLLSAELTALFYKLLKYMNGESSLELLLVKENVSRHDLRQLLAAIEEHIISVKHW